MTSTPGSSPARFRELDSLRGLAALSVLSAHVLAVYPLLDDVPLDGVLAALSVAVTSTPLGIVVTGGSAVRIFFVLSGFVLALPFLAGRGDRWTVFAVRRVLRLWPPFVAALVLAVALRMVAPDRPLVGLGESLQPNWQPPLTAEAVLLHVPLVTSFPYYTVDSPMWSLAHEMRISLVFPALVALVLGLRWRRALLVGLAIGVAGAALGAVAGDSLVAPSQTLQFVVLFVVGIALAKHRHSLTDRYQRLPAWMRLTGWVVAGGLYVWPNLPLPEVLTAPPLDNWAVMAGSAWTIVGVQSEPWLRTLLHRRTLTFLGDISYSLYLVHLPVLMAALSFGFGRAPTPVVLAIAVVTALLAATALHAAVEQPAIGWSRAAGRRMRRARQPVPAA